MASAATKMSRTIGEARLRAKALYRAAMRNAPAIARGYELEVPAATLKVAIRNKFDSHRNVGEAGVIDVLCYKGELELQETLMMWKTKVCLVPVSRAASLFSLVRRPMCSATWTRSASATRPSLWTSSFAAMPWTSGAGRPQARRPTASDSSNRKQDFLLRVSSFGLRLTRDSGEWLPRGSRTRGRRRRSPRRPRWTSGRATTRSARTSRSLKRWGACSVNALVFMRRHAWRQLGGFFFLFPALMRHRAPPMVTCPRFWREARCGPSRCGGGHPLARRCPSARRRWSSRQWRWTTRTGRRWRGCLATRWARCRCCACLG